MLDKKQEFKNYIEIDEFFKKYNSSGFVDWFNKNIFSERVWSIRIKNQANWQKVWANVNFLFGKNSINIIEFLSINSIIINETGGEFIPLSETIGTSGHPGIAYAFDKITGTKKSYNTLNTNKTALTLFKDAIYRKAHGTKPLSFLKDTTDNRWSGESFPIGFTGNIDTETNKTGKTNTFLTEADFMKFRGRGYIQTTGRENYKSIIDFVLNYNSTDSVIYNIKKAWSFYKDVDSIASISTNQQWDDLFLKTDSIIANYGCYVHSTLPSIYKNYNIINPLQTDLNLHKSIRNVALAISGSSTYANKFLERVLVQISALDNNKTNVTALSKKEEPTLQSQEEGRTERTGQDIDVKFKEVSGNISTVTNIFKPTAKPSPISFNIE